MKKNSNVYKERTLFQIASFNDKNNKTPNIFFLKQKNTFRKHPLKEFRKINVLESLRNNNNLFNVFVKSLRNTCDGVHFLKCCRLLACNFPKTKSPR